MTTKTDDQEMTRNVCRRQIDSLARLELMIVEANYNGPDADAVQTFIDEEGLPDDEIFSGYDLLSFWLDTNVLEITVNERRPLILNDDDERRPVSVELLLGFGGPNVVLTVPVNSESCRAFLAVTWWGDRATAEIDMPELHTHLEEWVNC